MNEEQVVVRRWYTVAEVAEVLGFGLTKTKALVLSGEIGSLKHGHHRRVPAAALEDFQQRVELENAV